ncbi:MAG: putative pyoverdin transport system ATP-binding/permease protein [Acidobacteriota bacterium]|nr:putative pyoverdin transport system ATP-binding/permease protein [Acidobacteriota bacterium]
MKLIAYLFRVSRATVILAIAFGVLSGASSTGLLALISTALTGKQGNAHALLWGFVGLCVLLPAFKFMADWLLVRLGQEAVFKLRVKLSRQILASPLLKLESLGPHRLLAALTEDVSSIINALVFIPTLFINVSIVCGCLIYLYWLSPAIFGIIMGALAIGVVTYQLPMLRGMRLQRNAREMADALYKDFRAITEGTKELMIHRQRRHAFLTEVLEEDAARLKRKQVEATTFFIAASSWGHMLFFAVIGILIFLAGRITGADIAILTGAAFTILYMMSPLELIMNTVSVLSRASVALDKIEMLGLSLAGDEKARREERPALAGGEAADDGWSTLQMVGVTHSYHREQEDGVFTIGPLDITFLRGELVFITGGNGSGKTTLIKLLIGLYRPESGEIRLDGRPVTDAEDYRQHFSAVFADFYLFEDLLGIDSPRLDVDALAYLKQLQLDHKVRIEDGHLSTIALSQGQRKRLALMVAYLEDRPIYIFDEWAADQDPQFKEVFYGEFLPALKARGKTIIVISHDDRYYDVADRVLKLANGKVEEAVSDAQAQMLYS